MRSIQLVSRALLIGATLCACGPAVDVPEGMDGERSSVARETAPELTPEQREQFGQDSRDFAFDLYRQVASRDANLLISPFSIRVALSMLYAGALGDTQREMAGALRMQLAEPALHAAVNAADLELGARSAPVGKRGAIELRVANGAFVRAGTELAAPFLDVLARHYGATLFRADFGAQAERERLAINAWVRDRTAGLIQDALPADAIDPGTTLMLANAIYFKGSWLEPFAAGATRVEAFHAPSGDVSVRMMEGDTQFYAQGNGYQAAELPYVSPALRMLLVLPDAGAFEAIQARLDRTLFDEIRRSLARSKLTLKMPKFTFESAHRLKPALRALGMQRAFEPGADFSGMASAGRALYLNEIHHKTLIELDEEGTKMAAFTAGEAVTRADPAQLVLDRPFLFVVYDDPTGQILFVGQLVEPK